ncbi:DUF4230 domain-containing protein [Thermoleptolyngbya sp.]
MNLSSFLGTVQGLVGRLGDRAKVYIGAGLVGFAVLAMLLFSLFRPAQVVTTESVRNLIFSGVENASEFVAATTDGYATVKVDEVAKKLGIPIGKTTLIYEGVGTVQAGFNLKELVVSDLDFKNRTITAELPAPRILNINLDIARSSKIDDYRSWFGPAVTAELYEEAQREALAIIREKACSGNLFKAASSSAKEQVRTILNKAGFNTVTVEVESGSCAA